MDSHYISFFGRETELIIKSKSKSDDWIFIIFRKKYTANGENPLINEEMQFILSINDIINIIRVLEKNSAIWSTIKDHNKKPYSIIFEKKEGIFSVKTLDCLLILSYSEEKVLLLLIKHFLKEKIEFATISTHIEEYHGLKPDFSNKSFKKSSITPLSTMNGEIIKNLDYFEEEPQSWLNKLEKDGEYVLVPGEILRKKGKALAFQIDGLNYIWLPLSQIKDTQSAENTRGLWVKDWIIKKKLDDIFEITI